VEHSVTVILKHLGVRVEAGVTQFRDLLGEQFHTIGRITEDDRLIDLQLLAEEKGDALSRYHN
jgi:hypothetical protein